MQGLRTTLLVKQWPYFTTEAGNKGLGALFT